MRADKQYFIVESRYGRVVAIGQQYREGQCVLLWKSGEGWCYELIPRIGLVFGLPSARGIRLVDRMPVIE